MREPSPWPPRLQRFALWQEITLVLVIKLIVLCFIWFAFFSTPTGHHLDADGVAQSLLNTPAPNYSQQETGHASRPGTR
jgi:hypothetical protein